MKKSVMILRASFLITLSLSVFKNKPYDFQLKEKQKQKTTYADPDKQSN